MLIRIFALEKIDFKTINQNESPVFNDSAQSINFLTLSDDVIKMRQNASGVRFLNLDFRELEAVRLQSAKQSARFLSLSLCLSPSSSLRLIHTHTLSPFLTPPLFLFLYPISCTHSLVLMWKPSLFLLS